MRKKPIVASILALIGLALALLVVFLATRPITRFIYSAMPLDADSALLLTRHNGDDTTRFFAQRVQADGAVRWDSEVTPFRTEDNLGFAGVAFDAERIYLLGLLGAADKGPAVLALDRKGGQRLWQVELGRRANLHRIAPQLFVDKDRLIVAHGVDHAGGGYEALTAISTADGKRVWPTDD
ncbi:MAG TPA: PQQ-binding-like beta-propeller repeat protein, partial [Myxococcota bacterium]|nr:PQQ-binding-like beta-propeller repeat protein [Myxococcota bacterium]